jgi:hypothetical protein
MARSFKKNPGVKDGDNGKFGKKCANRRVRHYKLWLPNGSTFKRLFEQWDIHDYNFRYFSKSETIRMGEKYGFTPYQYWMK